MKTTLLALILVIGMHALVRAISIALSFKIKFKLMNYKGF